jgi:hypothetical protein
MKPGSGLKNILMKKSKLDIIIESSTPNTTPQFQGYVKKAVIQVLREIKKNTVDPKLQKIIEDFYNGA